MQNSFLIRDLTFVSFQSHRVMRWVHDGYCMWDRTFWLFRSSWYRFFLVRLLFFPWLSTVCGPEMIAIKSHPFSSHLWFPYSMKLCWSIFSSETVVDLGHDFVAIYVDIRRVVCVYCSRSLISGYAWREWSLGWSPNSSTLCCRCQAGHHTAHSFW